MKKRRLSFDEDRHIIIYPEGFKLENTSIMPSIIHYENKSYIDIPIDEFDSFVKMKTDYLKVFLVKGIKYDLFIHQNCKKKEVIHPEDEINGIHIVKDDDLENYIKNIELYKDRKEYKI